MERHRAPERLRVALDPGGAAAELPLQLVQQPRLADPRLADDHRHLTLSGLRQLEALAQQPQLALAADEARAAGLGVAHHAARAVLRAAAARQGNQVEAAGQEAAGRGGGRDAAGRRAGDEPVEHPLGVLAGGGVHADHVPLADHGEHLGVERHHDGRHVHRIAPGTGRQRAHGQGGVGGAPGRVFIGLEAEGGEQLRRPRLLDAAAEAPHLGGALFQAAVHLPAAGRRWQQTHPQQSHPSRLHHGRGSGSGSGAGAARSVDGGRPPRRRSGGPSGVSPSRSTR